MNTPINGTVGNSYISQYTNYELEDDELRTQLTRRDTQMAVALNLKTNGIFETIETQDGEQFFSIAPNTQQTKRFVFRLVVPFGQILKTDPPLAITHNIQSLVQFTHIYGTAITDAPDFRPIPYSSVTAVTAQIEVRVTATQVIITNGTTAPNIVSGMIVLEYLKN